MRRSKPYIDSNPDEPTQDPPETTTATTEEAHYGAELVEPKPGATQREKQPLPLQIGKKSRPRKLLSKNELRAEEKRLLARYPHIVQGSLRNATKGELVEGLTPEEIHKYKHKRSIIIECQRAIANQICGVKRRIATSDLAQVTLCETCTTDERNARKRERRAAVRQAREATRKQQEQQ
jgi:hypothetical protein